MSPAPSSNSAIINGDPRRVFYLLTFTRWFPVGFVVGIFVLLATSRGLSTTQALTYMAVSGVVCFLLELPTSGFADAFGRRPVYLVAAVLNVATALLYALAHTFWAFVAAAALMGAFRALDSGPLEAWFVDAVHEVEPGKDVDQELSRSSTILGLAMAAGAVLSGALIWWHPFRSQPPLDVAVWAFVALSVVHLLASAAWLRETPRHEPAATRAAAVRASARQSTAVIRDGLRLMVRNPVIAGLLLAEVAWSTGMIAFEALMPLRLEELVGSAQRAGALVGPVAAAGWGIFAAGTWLAGRASARLGVARAAMLGRGLNALGVIVMSLAVGPIGLVAAYLFTYSMHGMNGPPHSALLHREASAANRSTVLSLNSMVAFLAFAVASPLAGQLADATSIATTMLVVGALSALGVAAYLPARRAERRSLEG
ncbi:MAG: MFS transporter [Dermatophilaceae bacterium]